MNLYFAQMYYRGDYLKISLVLLTGQTETQRYQIRVSQLARFPVSRFGFEHLRL